MQVHVTACSHLSSYMYFARTCVDMTSVPVGIVGDLHVHVTHYCFKLALVEMFKKTYNLPQGNLI